jgi:hypothetical protein
LDNERFQWWLAQVCLRAHHIRRPFAKLAQLIVCHLLKPFAKLVYIERRQLNFWHGTPTGDFTARSRRHALDGRADHPVPRA